MAATSHMTIVNSVFFFCLLVFSFSEAIRDHHYGNGGGVTTSLFHRDSQLSPLYDPSLSHYDRLKNAFLRSISRSEKLIDRATSSSSSVSPDLIQSPLTSSPGGGEFFMHLSIGTPPVEFVAIADTGSDLTWTQCLPCKKCFNQSQPLFNPRRSSSYSRVPCTSDDCHAVENAVCGADKRTCDYLYGYGDQSFTNGEIGYEKITLGSSSGRSFVLRNSIIGCGHENGGSFDSSGSGIIGLGGGVISLVSQLSKISHIRRRFSYCLPSFLNNSNPTGKINFGRNPVVSGRSVVSTPLIPKFPDTFYYLTLEAVTVGTNRLSLETAADALSESNGRGNIIIDSGTTLTFLPQNLYLRVVSTLEEVIKAKRVADPSGVLHLCYAVDDDDEDIDIPVITVHFTGADVELQPLNTFAKVADDVICLTFAPSSSLSIFGNLAQMNFLIGYDLDYRRLTFKPAVCA